MLAMVALMTACGSTSNDQAVNDSVVVIGPDSSVILPDLTDSAKADSVGSATTDSTARIPAQ
jgi:hypothetical protein